LRISLSESAFWLRASCAGRKECRREGAREVVGVVLAGVADADCWGEGEREGAPPAPAATPGTESMLARVEVGAVAASGRMVGEGGAGAGAGSFPAAAGRSAWSWCADDDALEPDLPCRGLVGFRGPSLLPFCCSSSAVEGVKYDWNFFMMVVTTGPGGFRGSPGTPCHFGFNSMYDSSGPSAVGRSRMALRWRGKRSRRSGKREIYTCGIGVWK
jgi:hypothetical protein